MRCELCERETERLTIHHLIPRQTISRQKIPRQKKGGDGPRAEICSACHRQIHALFDNTTLARELNCVERLRDEPRMRRFLAWVRKQDPDRRVKVRGGRR
jgi:hypothetical protein